MSTYYRRDDWVQDAMGNAQSGVSVYVCSQPANTSSIPPSPLATIYSDNAGADPITQPVETDGYGHAFFYAAQGTYTIVYFSPQIQEVILVDQIVVSPFNEVTTTWNNDSGSSITGAINGTNTVFTLSAQPLPPQALIFMVNGVVQTGFTISGSTVTLAVAPHTGDVLNAIYQTT
jgi:hypothetical protein